MNALRNHANRPIKVSARFYGVIHFEDPLDAKALFERLEGKFKEIGNAPDIGTQRLDLGEEFRTTTVESYVVYFTIKEDGIAAIPSSLVQIL